MPNTYAQLYIQFIFSVKRPQNLIKESFWDELEKAMCGIVNNHKCKTYAIYCNLDHNHLFVGMHPTIALQNGWNRWNRVRPNGTTKKYVSGKFLWKDSYGGFTYSKSHLDKVVKYIL